MLISLLSRVSRKAGVAEGIRRVREVTYRSLYISSGGNLASGVNELYWIKISKYSFLKLSFFL